MTPPQVHPTALVEPGVELGCGTAVWDNAHLRAPARIGQDCIIGEKTYVAPGVQIGDRVKVNAFVYLCSGVTVEDGVMLSAGVVFTNDRFPRATTADLTKLRPSDPDEHTEATTVREGATVGARALIGPGLDIGRFAMVGMGAVVTRPVEPFHLVIGHPARPAAVVCRCGTPVLRAEEPGALPDAGDRPCPACGLRYRVSAGHVAELSPPPGESA